MIDDLDYEPEWPDDMALCLACGSAIYLGIDTFCGRDDCPANSLGSDPEVGTKAGSGATVLLQHELAK